MKMERMRMNGTRVVLGLALALTCAAGTAFAVEQESKRLARAKDYIAEEQYTRAVAELRAALKDAGETRKDEVLYWLAHSLNESGDAATSLTTIIELERTHRSSLWVKPARALRLEIARRLGRNDVLWFMARPPAPPAPPAPAAPTSPPAPAAAPRTETPPLLPPPPHPVEPHHPTPAPPAPPAIAPAPPVAAWMHEDFHPDMDLRIQALGHLIHIDADKAIPFLKEMAFEAETPGVASRAVFLLAQSQRPEARATVVQVARTGPPQVRVAAVRELARFGGPEAGKELMQVYTVGDVEVKRQVVRSLGERWERVPLLTIARSERNAELKSRAILMLGRAGGTSELRQLYPTAGPETKRPIILSLFNARAEDDLIAIAERERDGTLRQEILHQLRLLGTPKAKAYVQKVK